MKPGEQRLRQALAALRRRRDKPPMELKPGNAFEVAVAEQLRYLQAELEKLRTQLHWLLTVIVGAALLNIVVEILK